MSEIYVEKWLTFTFFDGLWDVQLWADSAKPVNAKLYRIKIRVPHELTGEVEAMVDEAKR